MYFSCFAKKSTKRRRPRGAELLAPASKAAPLETPGTHLRSFWSTLTYILFGQKMSRFFARRVSFMRNGRAGVVEQPAFVLSLNQSNFAR